MKNTKSIFILLFMLIVPLFLTGGKPTKHKEMYFDGEVRYLKRTEGPWNKRGRVVGVLDNPPQELEIEFYSISRGRPVYKYKAPGKMYIYASRFLPPGRYNVTFKAEGYANLTKKNLKVIREADCMVNIRFSSRVFTNR